MSWQATAWAARQTAGSPGRKAILLLVANHASSSGVCFPGRRTLAAEAECTPTTVTANIAALESLGLVERHERRRANGSRTTDWIVLGPRAADRGEMHDADPDEFPGYIVEGARRGSGQESSGEVHGGGQVKPEGGPGQSRTALRGRESASAHPSPMRIGRKPVDEEHWMRTERTLAEFNAQAGRKLRLVTSAGEPSEAARRIYGRMVSYPDLSAEEVADIIGRTLASRWWGTDDPSIGVVFGPQVFEENITRAATPRKVAGDGLAERQARRRAALTEMGAL